MIEQNCFALNRIIAPSMGIQEFFEFAYSTGIRKVELRNDLGAKNAIDGLSPSQVAKMASDRGINILSINALQKFNLGSHKQNALSELSELIELAKAISCRAIVLCPNNDPKDARNKEQQIAETIDALATFGPLFTKAGILGLIEPLGFSISSLSSLLVAQECIRKSGFSCYRVVYDTFHHYIGPDDLTILGKNYDVKYTGLVHISGVEDDIPISQYHDQHRILVGPNDRMKSKEQILLLHRLGFSGDLSFEPFSPQIQNLSPDKLAYAIQKSIEFILS